MDKRLRVPAFVLALLAVFGATAGVASASPPQWQPPVHAAPSVTAPAVGTLDTDDDIARDNIQCWLRGQDNTLWWRLHNVRHDDGVAFSGYLSSGVPVPANLKDGDKIDTIPNCPPVSTCGGHAGHIVQQWAPRQNASYYVDPVGCSLRHVLTSADYFYLVNNYHVVDDKVQMWFVFINTFNHGPDMSCQYPVPTGTSWHPI